MTDNAYEIDTEDGMIEVVTDAIEKHGLRRLLEAISDVSAESTINVYSKEVKKNCALLENAANHALDTVEE